MERLVDLFKTMGNVVETCSRAGEFKAMNVSLQNSSLVSTWPTGNYMTLIKFNDKKDMNIYNLTFYALIKH